MYLFKKFDLDNSMKEYYKKYWGMSAEEARNYDATLSNGVTLHDWLHKQDPIVEYLPGYPQEDGLPASTCHVDGLPAHVPITYQ